MSPSNNANNTPLSPLSPNGEVESTIAAPEIKQNDGEEEVVFEANVAGNSLAMQENRFQSQNEVFCDLDLGAKPSTSKYEKVSSRPRADDSSFRTEDASVIASSAAPAFEDHQANSPFASSVFVAGVTRDTDKAIVEAANLCCVIVPWSLWYQTWWGFTVFGAIFTVVFELYEIAFSSPTTTAYNDASSIIEYMLVGMFALDIVVVFFLAFYDRHNRLVYDHWQIAKNYLKFGFWMDLVGVFPFFYIVVAATGQFGKDNQLVQFLSLVRLTKMVRLRRMKKVFEILQYNSHVSLFQLTLARNFVFALVWTHFAACVMYYIARMYNFDPENTWLGGSLDGLNGFKRYTTSLYWSVVTFTTVGYGDFSPVNPVEQIWGMIYMLLNMVFQAWMIGSITLLIVKQDERTGDYRDSLKTLQDYSALHGFDLKFHKMLKTQLQLEFQNKDLSDETVLQHFPPAIRRKVLRKLYLPAVCKTQLMKGVRQQFVDSFLMMCNVEIFTPGEEIVQRGAIGCDLYLLVEGSAQIMSDSYDNKLLGSKALNSTLQSDTSSLAAGGAGGLPQGFIRPGQFIGDIAFFTESSQPETVIAKSVAKTLALPKHHYKTIANEYPTSCGKILKNLLDKVKARAESERAQRLNTSGASAVDTVISTRSRGKWGYIPKQVKRAFGSAYNFASRARLASAVSATQEVSSAQASTHAKEVEDTVATIQAQSALSSVEDVVQSHLDKLRDEHTARFLFAAARGDTNLIALMCEQGFNPNNSNYDDRTALMVAAMRGNTEAVLKILEFQANPNLVDKHGTSALYEAARNGCDETMNVLLEYGAKHNMSERMSAAVLCQAVSDGDVSLLRRLLRARIPVDAEDYDRRTAAHVAAADGNVSAMKVLVEVGKCDLERKDRWGITVRDEAQRSGAVLLQRYLESLTLPPQAEQKMPETASDSAGAPGVLNY